MAIAYAYYYVEDLRRLATSIESARDRQRFLDTVADNSNHYFQTPDGRTVAKLYELDIDKVIALQESSGFLCAQVSPEPGE